MENSLEFQEILKQECQNQCMLMFILLRITLNTRQTLKTFHRITISMEQNRLLLLNQILSWLKIFLNQLSRTEDLEKTHLLTGREDGAILEMTISTGRVCGGYVGGTCLGGVSTCGERFVVEKNYLMIECIFLPMITPLTVGIGSLQRLILIVSYNRFLRAERLEESEPLTRVFFKSAKMCSASGGKGLALLTEPNSVKRRAGAFRSRRAVGANWRSLGRAAACWWSGQVSRGSIRAGRQPTTDGEEQVRAKRERERERYEWASGEN
ncbi:hypothetical protein KSP39_PZI018743 [Platanthera zijinensis]|uniref:Uncharacterized protein n=1 Tax=Platanthera zijinensis TaxID=2320716 RepID=A0AAP0FYN0_9ASPA